LCERIEPRDLSPPGGERSRNLVQKRAGAEEADGTPLRRPAAELICHLALIHLNRQTFEEVGGGSGWVRKGSLLRERVGQSGRRRADVGEAPGAQPHSVAAVSAGDDMRSGVGEREDAGWGSHGFFR